MCLRLLILFAKALLRLPILLSRPFLRQAIGTETEPYISLYVPLKRPLTKKDRTPKKAFKKQIETPKTAVKQMIGILQKGL